MRKAIRLTGRRQLPQSAFSFQLTEVKGQKAAVLAVPDSSVLATYPATAEIRVKLVENKLVEVISFGFVGNPSLVPACINTSFRAPSCQIRIVSRSEENHGMLLASTNSWTLSAGGQPDGILLFQPAPIAPRLWKLDIRSSEKPILYIDERIPDAGLWAKSDPVFAACVLPHVVSEIVRSILSEPPPEEGWEFDWINWAQSLLPGQAAPFGDDGEHEKWIDDLIEAFSWKHDLAGVVLKKLEAVK